MGDDGRTECGPGHVAYLDLPGALTDGSGSINDDKRCDQEFNARVTNLEYLNEDNIAITYLSVKLKHYDIATHTVQSGKARFPIVYYNPSRNAIQDAPWQKDIGITATGQGQLCPAMRRFPQLGSLAAESIAIGVNLLRFGIRMVVGLPGIIDLWKQGL